MALRYLDLFCGAGGMSEGFSRAGFKPVAHIDIDEAACFTVKTRNAVQTKFRGIDLPTFYPLLLPQTWCLAKPTAMLGIHRGCLFGETPHP
jgi:site-specific DNA-cytosine methylase